MNITEITVPVQEVAWLPWAVQYFFFIALATTAAGIAALADLGGGERWRRIQPAALLLALSTAVVAPVALLADLHQPGRFWHFYAHFTPWSWMSIGSLLLPLFIALLLAYALLWLRLQLRRDGGAGWLGWLAAGRRSGAALLPWLAAACLLSALSILLYTGAELMVVRARPLWATAWLPVNLALTGLLASLGGILLLQRWVTGAAPADTAFVNRLLLATLVAIALAAGGWAVSGWAGGGASFTEAARLFAEFASWRAQFFGSLLLGGLLLAGSLALLLRPHSLAQAWWLALPALLAAWAFRWVVLMNVQTVPKYGAGLYPYDLPLGSDGLLGIVATFGLWLAVLVGLTSAIAWRAADASYTREVSHG